MPRSLTTRNKAHPHNRLKDFLQTTKEEYRKHTTETLYTIVNGRWKEGLPLFSPEATRSQLMEWLRVDDTRVYKTEWQRVNGWNFDDCYDQDKLDAHGLRAALESKGKEHRERIEYIEGKIRELDAKASSVEGITLDEDSQRTVWHAELRALQEKSAQAQLTPSGVTEPTMPEGAAVADSYPEGLTAEDVYLGPWNDYDQEEGYSKAFAQVETLEGKVDPVWYWPNADFFGPHSASIVKRVRYAYWKDEPVSAEIFYRGRQITKEAFDKLDADMQKAVRNNLHNRLMRIKDSGFAGVLPGGGIVDRRLFPSAIAMQENKMLGVPPSKPLAPDQIRK